jgi:hypothetical protein
VTNQTLDFLRKFFQNIQYRDEGGHLPRATTAVIISSEDDMRPSVRHLLTSVAGTVAVLLAAVQPRAQELRSGRFDVRVEAGKAAEREFIAYQSAMAKQVGDHLAQTMQSCFATTERPETEAFVLVADITVKGNATAIEVRPGTNIATCFAHGIASAVFPKPPQYADHEGFPITIEMHIR